MKREVLCKDCAVQMRKMFPNDSPYPGEHVKFVNGKSKVQCICDRCSKPINPGDEICAFSSWADYGGVPYSEWEDEYLEKE